MKKLPKHEATSEKQAAAEYQNRFLKNNKISYVLITFAVLAAFGALCYLLKSSGILFSI